MTIMRARGRRMAKTVLSGGKFKGYDDAKHYNAETLHLAGLKDLWSALHRLLPLHDRCIVRGKLIHGEQASRIRRLAYRDNHTGDEPTLIEVPRRWLALDADSIALPDNIQTHDLIACADVVMKALPAAFEDARAIIQASAGHAIKPGARLRLWFWCDRPLLGDEAKRWLAGRPFDSSVFRTVQPIYTAAPIFTDGMKDHLPHRLAKWPGYGLLHVPAAEELAPRQQPLSRPRSIASDTTARRMLQRCLDRVSRAGEGQRHVALRSASLTAGGLLGVDVAESEAAQLLLEAVQHAGGSNVDARNAAATIAWGLKKGSARPLRASL